MKVNSALVQRAVIIMQKYAGVVKGEEKTGKFTVLTAHDLECLLNEDGLVYLDFTLMGQQFRIDEHHVAAAVHRDPDTLFVLDLYPVESQALIQVIEDFLGWQLKALETLAKNDS